MMLIFVCPGCDKPMAHAAALAEHSVGCEPYQTGECLHCGHQHWTPRGHIPCPSAGCACPNSPADDILEAAFGGAS